MKTMDTVRRYWFPVFLIFVVWFSYLVAVHTSSPNANSYLNVEVTPQSSRVVVDGVKVRPGKVAVVPGVHNITFSKKGFSTEHLSASAQVNQTVYVGAVLQSNSPDTSDWYETHPLDRNLVDGIASHQADYEQKVALQTMPFLKQLPLVYGDGHGGIINISPGAPMPPSTLPAIYVTAPSPQDRQSAVIFIRSRGYDLADMNIVYKDMRVPLEPVDTKAD